MTYALGIDIGTTFSAAAVWRDGRAETVPLGNRANAVPSVVLLRDDHTLLVGDAAARRAIAEPHRVAREFKRRIGDRVPLVLGDQAFSPQQLLAALVAWVIERVSEREGAAPDYVTLTHPANWGEFRKGLLRDAVQDAGLVNAGMIAEPVAAAVHYASQERVEAGVFIGVYDLGGGTFDATVLRKTADGFEIHGTPEGDDRLGGIDFDQAVISHVRTALGETWSQLDLGDLGTMRAVAQVRANAVEAKEALSTDIEAGIAVILPGITDDVRLTRTELETALRAPLQRTVDIFRQAVERSGIEPSQLRHVLLVGGSSRIPLVSQMLTRQLGVQIAVDAHPKYAVCLGAAIAAGTRLARGDGTRARQGVAPVPTALPDATDDPMGSDGGDRAAGSVAAGTPAGTPVGGETQEFAAIVGEAAGGAPGDTERIDVDLVDRGLTEALDVPFQPPRRTDVPDAMVKRVAPHREVSDTGDAPVEPPADETEAVAPRHDDATENLEDLSRTGAASSADRASASAPAGGDADWSGRVERGRARRPVAIVVLLAFVLLAGVVAARAFRSDDPEPERRAAGPASAAPAAVATPDPSPSPSAPAQPPAPVIGAFDLAGLDLTDVSPPSSGDFDATADNKVEALTVRDDIFLAVGRTPSQSESDALVLRSSDGRRWEVVLSDELGGDGVQQMLGVTPGPDGVIGVGVDGARPDGDAAVWTGLDRQVERVMAPDLGGDGHQEMRDIAWHDGQYVAVGCEDTHNTEGSCEQSQAGGHRAAVWLSPDGRTWSRVDPGAVEGADTAMWGVTSTADGLVAVGNEQPGGEESRSAAFWFSADGTEWSQVDVALADDARESSALGVDTFDGLTVVVGYDEAATGLSGDKDPAVWRSTDGREWEQVAPDERAPGNQVADGVVGVPDGFVAVGRDYRGGDLGAVWISGGNAAQWRRQYEDVIPVDDGVFQDVTASADHLVLGGHGSEDGLPGVRLWEAPAD